MEDYIQVGEHIFRTDQVDDELLDRLGMSDAPIIVTQEKETVPHLPTKRHSHIRVNSKTDKPLYTVSVLNVVESHLHLRVEGVWANDTGRKILDQIDLLSGEYEAESLLIDFTSLEMKTGTVDEFYMVHDMVGKEFYKFIKIAVISVNKRTSFFERIAQNKMINIKFFADEMDATGWLEAGNRASSQTA